MGEGKIIPACIGGWQYTENGCSWICDTSEKPTKPSTIVEQECDANKLCESGDCYKFEDRKTPVCYEGDVCSRCESGNCNVAESYPMQVFCN